MLDRLVTTGVCCLALASLMGSITPALAQPLYVITDIESVITDNCVRTRRLGSCTTIFRNFNGTPHIIAVPKPLSEQQAAEHQQRDKRWQERCRPAIGQDEYGVSRYYYAARGCEFGRLD